MVNTIALLFVVYVLPSTADTIPAVDYSVAYQACTEAASKHTDDVSEVLKKCEEPARQGVPGAQYVMGALLTNRNVGTDRDTGVEWLEKAVAAGSPAAAFHLGSILASSKDVKSIDRARELFKAALCAGYPAAVSIFEKEGASKTSEPCPSTADTDFSGEWILSMKWDKKALAGTGAEDYRISISGAVPRVYVKVNGSWMEAKPGKFSMSQQEQSITVSATDSGWDFDGKWIESWTFQLMRTSADDAAAVYLRTVNNLYLPPKFKWRTFSTFADGSAHRVKP